MLCSNSNCDLESGFQPSVRLDEDAMNNRIRSILNINSELFKNSTMVEVERKIDKLESDSISSQSSKKNYGVQSSNSPTTSCR